MCPSLAQLNKITEPFNSSPVVKEDYKPGLCNRPKPLTHAPDFPSKTNKFLDYVSNLSRASFAHSYENHKPVCSGPKHHTLLDAETTYAAATHQRALLDARPLTKTHPGYTSEKTDADSLILLVPFF